MKCKCGGKTKVLDSQPTRVGTTRRRQCLKCKERFSTCEISADELQEIWRQMNLAKAAFVAMAKLIKGFE